MPNKTILYNGKPQRPLYTIRILLGIKKEKKYPENQIQEQLNVSAVKHK